MSLPDRRKARKYRRIEPMSRLALRASAQVNKLFQTIDDMVWVQERGQRDGRSSLQFEKLAIKFAANTRMRIENVEPHGSGCVVRLTTSVQLSKQTSRIWYLLSEGNGKIPSCWTRETLAARLGGIKPTAVSNLIWRIRLILLSEGGVNPYVLQTGRNGVRLHLKRVTPNKDV